MGVVYRAVQLALDRTVALKVIAPGLLDDRTIRARFVRESKVAASIDHPNVIPIYYAGEEDGVAYIAMRYVPGDDIRSLVRREGRLEPERAAHIVAQIGAALDAAHAAGLVHRDIKPANVLLGPSDHVYLTDFGLTKHALSTAGATKPGHWVGTLDYVSPEQIRGERVDARSDVYALGCLLFFALTGARPVRARRRRGQAVGARVRAAAETERARRAARRSTPWSSARWPRIPTTAIRRPATSAAARSPPRAGRQPEQSERLVATGAAAPIESETLTAARPANAGRGRGFGRGGDRRPQARAPARAARDRAPGRGGDRRRHRDRARRRQRRLAAGADRDAGRGRRQSRAGPATSPSRSTSGGVRTSPASSATTSSSAPTAPDASRSSRRRPGG